MLDVVFSSISSVIGDVKVVPGISDHDIVLFTVNWTYRVIERKLQSERFISGILFVHFQIMYKILFLCRFNGIVYFVSSLLIPRPSRRIFFLNSNCLPIIPFIDFSSQFMCKQWGVFIETRLFWSGACLSTISINKLFQTFQIVSGFVSE